MPELEVFSMCKSGTFVMINRSKMWLRCVMSLKCTFIFFNGNIVFPPPMRYVYGSVCWSVFQQDYRRTTGPIYVKLGARV